MDLIKVIMYIFSSRQEREILFEATRTCVWLKIDVCSMCVRSKRKPDSSKQENPNNKIGK